jgi:RNA polymerase sigma factor (sigma-70 family)
MFVRRQVRQDMSSVPPQTARQILRDFEKLINAEARLSARMTRHTPWFGFEDYAAVGQIAAMEAFVLYRPECGASLKTWIGRMVRWRMREAVRRVRDPLGLVEAVESVRRKVQRGEATPAALEAAEGQALRYRTEHVSTDEDPHLLPTVWETPEDVYLRTERREVVYSVIEELDLRQQHVMLAEMHGESGTDLAASLGITRQRVSSHRLAAKATLRVCLADEYADP